LDFIGAGAKGKAEVLSPDLSAVTAFSDIVLRLRSELIHLDFQSGADPQLPRRLLLYHALLYHRYGLPVHTVVILLHPRADRRDLSGQVRYAPHDLEGSMDFRFQIVRVWMQTAQLWLRGPLGMAPLAVLGRLSDDRHPVQSLPEVIRGLEEQLRTARLPRPQRAEMMTTAWLLCGLRVSRRQANRLFSGVAIMRESSTYLALIEEGEVRGVRRAILKFGTRRFGPADAATTAALEAITNLARLDRMAERVHEVVGWKELLETP
jgi:hypothetical protein